MAGQRSVGCQGSSGAAKQPGSPSRCTSVKGLSCIPSPSQPKPFQTQNVKYIPSRYLLVKLTSGRRSVLSRQQVRPLSRCPCGEGTLVSSSGVCWAGFAGSTSKVTPVTTYLFLTHWKGIKMQAVSYSGASNLLCEVYFLFSLSHCPNAALEKQEQDSFEQRTNGSVGTRCLTCYSKAWDFVLLLSPSICKNNAETEKLSTSAPILEECCSSCWLPPKPMWRVVVDLCCLYKCWLPDTSGCWFAVLILCFE